MSIASEIQRLQTAKADIKTAIEAKGVTVPSSATIDTYDDYVSQITGGMSKNTSGTPYCNGLDLVVDVQTEISIDGGTSWVNSGSQYTEIVEVGGCGVPQGYTEVEYIRNSNFNAYINTGIILFDNRNNSYTITVRLTSEFHSDLSCATIINAEKPVSPYNGLGYRYKCSSTVDELEFFGGQPNFTSSVIDNGDGTKTVSFQSTGATTWTTNAPLTFCCAFSNTAYTVTNRFADASIYSATIVKNGVTVRDLVPVKRDSDSVYGLYDLVTREFYTSPNGNNFSGGSIV